MPGPTTTPQDRATAARAARQAARRAAMRLALDGGAPVITRQLYPGAQTTVRDIEPLAGARAARAVETGARHAARGYIRDAREAGHGWQQIGEALGLAPDGGQAGRDTAEAAWTYATGQPGTHTAQRYGPSFAWTCRTCDQTITDHGPCNGPADDEHRHAGNCERLAAAIAAWHAGWEAGQ